MATIENISPVLLRQLFATSAARDKFDKLNELHPEWIYGTPGQGVYLSPTIEIGKNGHGPYTTVANGYASTVDEAVERHFEAIVKAASQHAATITVNGTSSQPLTYDYSPKSGFQRIRNL